MDWNNMDCVMTYSFKPVHYTLVVKKFIQADNYKSNGKIYQEAEKRAVLSHTEQLTQKSYL